MPLPYPRLIRRILTEDGRELVPSKPQPIDQVLSKEVARASIEAMEACTGPDGTATSAAIRGYGVAGKTGTAQKPATGYRRGKKVKEEKKGYAEDAWISSFVGLVPARDPKLAILILVDEPEGRGFGGVVAAPIFKEIATWALRYLGIPSEEVRPIKVSSVSKAKKKKLPEPPKSVTEDTGPGLPSIVAVGVRPLSLPHPSRRAAAVAAAAVAAAVGNARSRRA